MKIQVNISDEMVEKVDYWAKKIGVSRSAFSAMAIGNAVMGYEKTMELADKFGIDIIEEYETKELTEDERKGQ